MLPTRDSFQSERHTQVESERMEKYFMQMEMARKQGQQYSYQTKQTLKQRPLIKDKEGHYIMIKGSIQEEDVTHINIYAPNIGALKYIKQI